MRLPRTIRTRRRYPIRLFDDRRKRKRPPLAASPVLHRAKPREFIVQPASITTLQRRYG
jgi:hypothetical protein